MRHTDPAHAGRPLPGQGGQDEGSGKRWLDACQRISLMLARSHVTRRVWPVLSRGMRQYWAARVPAEVPARLHGDLSVPVRLWEHVEAGIFWYGFPAEDLPALEALLSAVPEDGVVLDIGANIGAFSLPLAARAKRGTVHSFEPTSSATTRLQRNIELNGLHNVVVNQCAASSGSDAMSLWVPEAHWKGRLYNSGRTSAYVGEASPGWRREEVAAIRLDDYVARQRLQRVDAIKIDVEGAELDVLEGASGLIRDFRPIVVMEMNDGPLRAAGRSVAEVLQFWRDHGYRMGTIAAGGRIRWDRPPAGGRHQNVCCSPAAGG